MQQGLTIIDQTKESYCGGVGVAENVRKQDSGKGDRHRRHVHVRRRVSWMARWRPEIEANHKRTFHASGSIVRKTKWCRHADTHADWTKTVRLA